MNLKLAAFSAMSGIGFVIFLVYLLQTVRFKRECPVCGNLYPDRSRRPRGMKSIPYKAYHCTACGKRFYHIGADNDLTLAS